MMFHVHTFLYDTNDEGTVIAIAKCKKNTFALNWCKENARLNNKHPQILV